MSLATIALIIGIITGVYEVLARFIPSIKDITLLGNIIRVLLAISDALNRKK